MKSFKEILPVYLFSVLWVTVMTHKMFEPAWWVTAVVGIVGAPVMVLVIYGMAHSIHNAVSRKKI